MCRPATTPTTHSVPSTTDTDGSNDPEAMKCVAEDSSITAGDCTDLSLLGMGMTQCCPTYVA